MWIVFRLVFAALVMLLRALWPRARSSEAQGGYNGQQSWQLALDRRATYFGVPFKHPLFFRLTRESWLDKIAKFFRLSREFQTGDADFDRATYIACDHPEALLALEASPEARSAARILLRDQNVVRIETDGDHLWARLRDTSRPSEAAISALRTLRNALLAATNASPKPRRGPFFWRALFVESLAWGVAFYGVPGHLELPLRLEPLYFDRGPVIIAGLTVAAALFGGLFFLCNGILGRSSRGHRILIEAAILLALGLPWTGIMLVSDYNTGRDTGAPVTHRFEIVDKTRKSTLLGKSRSAHLVKLVPTTASASPSAEPPAITWLRIQPSDYNRVRDGDHVELDMRPGHLGFPWLSDVRLQFH
jgi:hypothetical protein